eukprot:XP_011673148.1 PREDICTED: angiotensin-converting enzyme 2-like [Strongylocentrotus purpuratus]
MSKIKDNSWSHGTLIIWIIYFVGIFHLGSSLEEGFEESREVHRRPIRQPTSKTLAEAHEFLRNYTEEGERVLSASTEATWNYEANLTDENAQKDAEELLKAALFDRKSANRAKEFNDVIDDFPAKVQRQFMFIRDIGVAALDKETVEEFNLILTNLSEIYSTRKVCQPDNATFCLNLEPGLDSIMASSRNWDERVWAWKGFRDAVGIPNKPLYAKYVQLVNQGARANGI